MSAQFTLGTKPAAGGPPPHELMEQRRQLANLANARKDDGDDDEHEDDHHQEPEPAPEPVVAEAPRRQPQREHPEPAYAPVPPPPAAVKYPAWMEDLQRRIETPKIKISIRINGVGIRLNIIDYHIDRSKICFLVADDIQCELPDSEDVKLEIDGREIVTGYMGQWHKIPSLPCSIVCFVGTDVDEEVPTP